MKTIIRILACALLALMTFGANASSLDFSALEEKMNQIKQDAVEGGKAASLAALTGGAKLVSVGVAIDGLAHAFISEDGAPMGFDAELLAATLRKANYNNYELKVVSADEARAGLLSGALSLAIGVTFEDALILPLIDPPVDPVALADAELADETLPEDGAPETDTPETDTPEDGAQAPTGGVYRSDAYLKGKRDATLIGGARLDLAGEAFYIYGAAGEKKLIQALNSTFEKVDIDGARDALWAAYFETGFLFKPISAVRRFALNIWRQFRINLIDGSRYKMILTGLWRTLLIACSAALLGIALGCVLALMRLSNMKIGRFKFLSWISGVYVDVIRGTPVVVQLMIMYYIILNSPNMSKITVAIISFGLNSGAYVSEMVRGGILAVDKGQTEAGRSLGLSSAATMCLIVLPQTIKIIIPSLFNEIITLLKETSVVGFIGLMDLTKAGDYIRSRTYSAFFPLLTVAAVYLIIVTLLTRVFNRVERRLRQSDIR